MGELHLEIYAERIRREYNCDIVVLLAFCFRSAHLELTIGIQYRKRLNSTIYLKSKVEVKVSMQKVFPEVMNSYWIY